MDTTRINHNNSGHKYRIAVDIAKEGSHIWDLTPYFKGRVGDNNFGLQVTWYYQGQLMNVVGMKPYIEGLVGQYSFGKNGEIDMDPDAVPVRYDGSPDDCEEAGKATFYFPSQMFPKEGIFKGFIGVKDDRDGSKNPQISGVTIWFKVLPGIAQMGHACDAYISDLDKALQNFKVKLDQHDKEYQTQLQQVIDDARTTYGSETKNAHDSLDALKAQIQANRDEQENLSQRLVGTEQKIAIGDVVTQSEFIDKSNWLVEKANEAVTQFEKSPVPYKSLNDLKKAYPNGSSGAYLSMDNKHIYVWFNSDWQDCGAYPAQGVVDHSSRVNKDINLDHCEPPYNDADTFPINSTVVVSDTHAVKNLPSEQMQTIITIKEADNGLHGALQVSVDANNSIYIRYSTQESGNYSSWEPVNHNRYNVGSMEDLTSYKANDLDKLPANSTFLYNLDYSLVKNLPKNWTDNGFMVHTIGDPTEDGCIQTISDSNLNTYWRITWKYPVKFQEWKRLYNGGTGTTLTLNLYNLNWNDKYQNMDNLPLNSRIVFSEAPSVHNLINIPNELKFLDIGFIIESNNQNLDGLTGGDYQLIISQNKQMWIRTAWGYPSKYGNWRMINTRSDNYYAKPSLAMFESLAVLGDSYTTGTTNFDNVWRSSTKIAWPSILARKNGIYLNDNYALGGITTKDWLDKFEADFLKSKPVDLYIIALGINDAFKRYAKDHTFLGTLTDINNSQQVDSFYWYYSKIIKDIRQVAPQAKIICTSLSNNPENLSQPYVAVNSAIKALAEQYKLPFINTSDDMLFNSNYFYSNMVGGHPVGPIYSAMANAYERLIQDCIISNFDYFERYGGTGISDQEKRSQLNSQAQPTEPKQ